jgi:hypothetical protein
VSGGSVGAAIYGALTQEIKEGDNRFEEEFGCSSRKAGGLFYTDIAEDILRDDFLSPVLTAFLFPDFFQRFLFFPIPYFDRARALERSLESSWDVKTKYYMDKYADDWAEKANPLREGFHSQWDPKKDVPALFINTTEVGSGRGRVIAPLSLETPEFGSFPYPNPSAGVMDIPLSSSAILSARFPLITPAGWYYSAPNESSVSKVDLVDGGYFDNSGAITALAIIEEINKAVRQMNPSPKLKIHLIVLTTAGFSDQSTVVGDYLAPFETLLSTRYARGRIAIDQAERAINGTGDPKSSTISFNKQVLNGYGYELPLGWRLR